VKQEKRKKENQTKKRKKEKKEKKMSRCPVCPTCTPIVTDAPFVPTTRPVSVGGPAIGGWSEWSEWSEWRGDVSQNQEIATIGGLVRDFLAPKRKFESFVVRRYREQTGSAGTNYILGVQADDFDISFDIFKSPTGSMQIKTTTGVFPLRRAECPRQCTRQVRRRRGPCAKYINGFGLCGDAADWGPQFLQDPNLGPFIDCTPCS
jgi:hypothetical protein